MNAVAALFGETPTGTAGALLQWFTLAILVAMGSPDVPFSWRLALAPVGVVVLLAGIVLAWRGNSLGPIIAIPAVLGIALIVLLSAILYPLRVLAPRQDDTKPQAKP